MTINRNLTKREIQNNLSYCRKYNLDSSKIQKATEFLNKNLNKGLNDETKYIISTIESKQDEFIQKLTKLVQEQKITKKDRDILTQKIEDESNQYIEYILHKKGKILHKQTTQEEWESILYDASFLDEIRHVICRIFNPFITTKKELDNKFSLLLDDIQYSNRQFFDNEERLYFKRRMEGIYNSFSHFLLDEFFTIESNIYYNKVSFDEFLPEVKPNEKLVNLDDIYGEEE